MDNTVLIAQLKEANEIINKIVALQQDKKQTNRQKDAIEKKTKDMADTPMWEVAIPLIISIIIWIQGVPFIASAVGFIILCVIIFSIDSYTLEKKRKLKAQTYYEDNMPPIEQKLSMLDQEIKNAWQTDEAKRMDELIPDDYQSFISFSHSYETIYCV